MRFVATRDTTQRNVREDINRYITEIDVADNNNIYDVSIFKYLKKVTVNPHRVSQRYIVDWCMQKNIEVCFRNCGEKNNAEICYIASEFTTQFDIDRTIDEYYTTLDMANNNYIYNISHFRYLKKVIVDLKNIYHVPVIHYCKEKNIQIVHRENKNFKPLTQINLLKFSRDSPNFEENSFSD